MTVILELIPMNGFDEAALLYSVTRGFAAQQLKSRSLSRISGKGVHMYKGVGGSLCGFYHFSEISHENEIIWSRLETKLFHFHRIFNNRGRWGGFERNLWTPSGSATEVILGNPGMNHFIWMQWDECRLTEWVAPRLPRMTWSWNIGKCSDLNLGF